MNFDLNNFKKSVDSIRNVRVMREVKNADTIVRGPFRNGAQLYMYRMILGLPQKTLAKQTNLSWELIRRVESNTSTIKKAHQEILEHHLTRQENAKAILRALVDTDGRDWLTWLTNLVGYRPKISQIRCSKCDSTNIEFITKDKYKALVKTTCNDCHHIRYSSHLLLVRTQKYRKEDVINMYDESLYKHSKAKGNGHVTIGAFDYELTPELIKATRLAVGLSQKNLAEISSFSRDVLRRCEIGTRQIDSTISQIFEDMIEKNTHLQDVFVQLHNAPRKEIQASIQDNAKSVAQRKLHDLTDKELKCRS